LVEAEFLFSVAEIAATFAGFATLIVVVAERLSGEQSQLVSRRFISMLAQSLIVIFFSLFPYLPLYAELPATAAWRLSSGVFAMAWLAYWVTNIRGYPLSVRNSLLSTGNKLHILVVHPAGIAAGVLGAVGVWGERTGLVYLCAILTMLYLCGYLFLQQVVTIARGAQDR
jgi:hypothetical protein